VQPSHVLLSKPTTDALAQIGTGVAHHGHRHSSSIAAAARCCAWVLRWLGGARRAWPHRGRAVDTQHAERPVSRDKTKKVHRICCRVVSTWLDELLFGPSTPDGPCAISDQPAESTGPRLGAGFQDAAREAEVDPHRRGASVLRLRSAAEVL
jgi:hypothetical protein